MTGARGFNKPHDSLCPMTWGRKECWCDKYEKVWREMIVSSGSMEVRGRFFMMPIKYVDGGVST